MYDKHEILAFTPYLDCWKCDNWKFKWYLGHFLPLMSSSRTMNNAPWSLNIMTMQCFVSLCACVKQDGWPQSLHCAHLWHKYQSRQKRKKNLFQINFSMKHLLTYQLLPQVRRLFFIFQQLCFAVVFLFDNTLFYHYALNTYSISGRQHAT